MLTLGDDGAVADDHVIAMPDEVYSAWLGGNPEYDADAVRYQYTSLVTPASAYDYDLGDAHRDAREAPAGAGLRPRALREPPGLGDRARRHAGPDLDRATGATSGRDGPGPMLLYGYGSYEVSIDPTFSASRVSLLDRGVVFAIAHVRGGGELGRHWYDDGKLLHKTNTFTDFIACAEHLVAEGWTSPDRLAARGGSAGGLLMGAVANLRPDLFRAIVAEVPFVDCLTTILDETLPLTITEWEEWGDPVHDPAVYELHEVVLALRQRRRRRTIPRMLVTGGLNDPRVQYWEPAKWVAKLRATKTDDRLLVLKMEMGAGHSGPSGRYDAWRDEAFVLAFLLDQLGTA